ncbi:adenylosuccinate synthase [Candidatus Sumerlaeota bacterium]|nr:adenylosuccinate synthase [Candidatus Sumerlaeota bacterium]
MSVVVVLGLQWGDEGKGKVIDWLSSKADLVARYQGGNNAGHTVLVKGQQYILHLIPSGIIVPGTRCLIGNGVVVNPRALKKEIEEMEGLGIEVAGRLFVSENAHCLMPYHERIDQLQESGRGAGKIGTTGRGIGVAYSDKVGRDGLRFCDIVNERRWDWLAERVLPHINQQYAALQAEDRLEVGEFKALLAEFKEFIKPYIVDGVSMINDAIQADERVLCEGAQGIMLDIDFGTYPYVTSSNPSTGGVCTGLGIPPMQIKRVVGVAKAYTTRVGEGPFPTEYDDVFGLKVRTLGSEFGATTGRPRRCGWFDAALLRRTVQITGATDLIITKLDVLDTLEEIKICTGYKVNGKEHDIFPCGLSKEDKVEPIYETLPGWQTSLCDIRNAADLPRETMDYVQRIEQLVRTHVTAVSVGAERDQTILTREISFFDL